MAYFHEMDLSKGWWFYFQLRIASKDIEFTNDIMSEMERLFLEVEGSKVILDKNGKKPKRVQVQRL